MEKYDSRNIAPSDFVYRHERPLVIRETKGATLTDVEGCRYLDMEGANGTVSLGYDAGILEEAVYKTRDLTSLPCFCESPVRLRVAGRIASELNALTGTEGRIAFELGGAQAMELALKVVRSYSDWSQYIVFEGASERLCGVHGKYRNSF